MMRVAVSLLALFALAAPTAVAARLASPPAPLPADVQQGLADYSIGVVDASAAASGSLPVRAAKALRIAKTQIPWTIAPGRYRSGWTLIRPITVHLVRLTEPPSGSRGLVSTDPLHAGSLAWLIVIRSAEIPVLGPAGGSYLADLAVLIETTRPRLVVALTI